MLGLHFCYYTISKIKILKYLATCTSLMMSLYALFDFIFINVLIYMQNICVMFFLLCLLHSSLPMHSRNLKT